MSLNGEIIKIGGLKEKLIGAVQAGIDTVCIPKGNEKDLDDVPASIKEKLQIHIIKEYDDVYQILFKKEKRSGLQNIPKK
ncbi:hypothetical protein FACS1894166_11470 [Bacilli bacterium]|nr:hypothetical protein FACS1894166_11470 [Bacilli bacterium]